MTALKSTAMRTVCGFCVTATLAMVAAPAAMAEGSSVSGSSSPPTATSQSAPPAAAPGGIRPLNAAYGQCNTFPGYTCEATYIMDTGIATATFLFSDGTVSSTSYDCTRRRTCTVNAYGHPNSRTRAAVRVTVNGPHVSLIYVGPTH